MALIEFTKDFETKKKGDTLDLDGMVANRLINQGVAKKRERKPKTTKKDK